MLISMNWIEDFVDLSGLDKISLIKRFTLSTAEVEEISVKGDAVRGVVAARIESVEAHPNSQKLHLLKVNTGSEVVDCVCGAPNVREGMVVPFATLGGHAGGMDIARAQIAGYESCGMCCSERELGISDDHSGLMELPGDTPLGTDLHELCELDDIVFEVDNKSLTNRPDLWGHYGIAREFSAMTGRALRAPELFDGESVAQNPGVDVRIEDPERAYRYTAAVVKNITRRVSPLNLRIRLFYCGLRAINFLADLTNYVMLELGQPMHAFDYRRVHRVNVRRFAEPFAFTTLDGTERRIDPETLMICANDEPVAIAGIMGGLNSEIEDDTDSLLLESANFDGITTRKSSVRLGLRTDASMRYEKMLDPELTMTAALRYLFLLRRYDGGAAVVSNITDVWVYRFPEISISFDKAYVDRYTGIDISADRIEHTLRSLGFGLEREGDSFRVEVPSWRRTKDVTIKADIIEEITRIYGYDNFEIRPSANALRPVPESAARRDDYAVKRLLCDRYNFHEVHSYIWSDRRKLQEIGIEVEPNVKIVNSLSTDWTILRRHMAPTMLSILNDNHRSFDRFGIFEIARVADGVREDGTCNEKKVLGVAIYDREGREKELYQTLLDALRTIGLTLKGEESVFRNVEATLPWQHPVNTAQMTQDGVPVGTICVVHPAVADRIDKKGAMVVGEVDMDAFSGIAPKKLTYRELSRFPEVESDLSLLVSRGTTYAELSAIADGAGCSLLTGYRPVDEYSSAALGNVKSLTVRFTFGDPTRTLSGEEVQEQVNRLIAAFAAHGIVLKA